MSETFDVFISYSHRDRQWVDQYLLPRLEQAGLRVAIDYRDFPLGRIAQENMERVVDASRHVVLVMSPNYIRSEWSGFEYFFASAVDPIGTGNKIIPILIAPTELPRRYSFRTYADFTDPRSYEREIARVIHALGVAAPAAPQPVSPPPVSPVRWQADLADLLVRSGRAQASTRRALCIEIGVDADALSFLDAAPRDFAVQLVNQLDVTGDTEGALALCAALGPVLKGVFNSRLQSVTESIRRSAPG